MPAFSQKINASSSHSSSQHSKGRESFFGVQAKLNIGKPNDKYEAEADKAADTIVSNKKTISPDPFFTASPVVQNKTGAEANPENKNHGLQKKINPEKISPVVQPKLKVVHNKQATAPGTFFHASPVIQ